MPKVKLGARQKLEKEQERKLVDDRRSLGKVLVPRPLDIDGVMRQVPEGKLLLINQIRDVLAAKFGANSTCPLCAGIFSRMAAEAAEEDMAKGGSNVTPYWRVLKGDGSLNVKYPGGAEAQAVRLMKEGHVIIPAQGKKPPKVKNYEAVLMSLSVAHLKEIN